MSYEGPNLGLETGFVENQDGWGDPYNEAMRRLDALTDRVALDVLDDLPGSPTDGDRYLLSASASENPNKFAVRVQGAWSYYAPPLIQTIFVKSLGFWVRWESGAWVDQGIPSHGHSIGDISGLSAEIAAKADASAVSSALAGKASTDHDSSHVAGGSDALPWTTIHGGGLLADRPAAASGNSGYIYRASDVNGGTLYRSTGSAWEQCAPGVSQGASVDFQNSGTTASSRSKANFLTANGFKLSVADDVGNAAAKISVVGLSCKPDIDTLLTSGALTGLNTGSGLSANDVDTGLHLNFAPGTTGKIRGYGANVSGTRCEIWMRRAFYGSGFGGGFSRAFAYARSTGGAFYTVGLNTSGNLVVEAWGSDTSYTGGTGTTIVGIEFSWIGLRFSGFSGTMAVQWSLDGIVWINLATGLSFTPITCGVGLWCNELIDAVFASLKFS